MPMVIPLAIQVGLTMAGYTAVQVAVASFVASVGVAIYQRQKAKRDARNAYNSSLQDRYAMVQTVDGARSRVYGRVRHSDGVIFKGSWGEKKENYSILVAIAGHEVDAIEQVYFNDVPITILAEDLVDNEPWGTTELVSRSLQFVATGGAQVVTLPFAPEVGTVTAQPLNSFDESLRIIEVDGNDVTVETSPASGRTVVLQYQYWKRTSAARVYTFTGWAGQDLSGMLMERFPDAVDSSFRFAGVACVLCDFRYVAEAFPNGIPSVSARVRGAKVFDPRVGLTRWTENPALCALDWAKYAHGGACDDDDLILPSFLDAANACDVNATYTTADGSTVNRKLYTCAYVARTDGNPEAHLAELVEAMGGKHAWSGGQLRVRAGVWRAPVMTVDEDMLSDKAARRISSAYATSDLVNVFRATIADASQDGQAVQLPELRAQTFIDADGQELVAEEAFGAVSFAPQAYHIMGMRMRDLRQGMTVEWPVNLRAFGLQVLDSIYVVCDRYGWPESAPKQFEVLGTRMDVANNLIALTLKETGASIWTLGSGFPVLDAEPNTLMPMPWVVAAVNGLDAVSGTAQLLLQADGSVVSRTRVFWSPVQDEAVVAGGTVEVAYKLAGSAGDWVTVSVPGDATEAFLTGLADGAFYLFRARARTRLGVGPWTAQIRRQALGKAEPPPVPDSFTVRAMPDGTRLLEGGYSAATRPVDLAGYRIRYRQGAGPYTWAEMLPFQSDDGFITSLPLETNLLAAGVWSIALAGVDTTGNLSEPLQIVGTLPNPRLGDALTYYNLEAIGWPGDLTDGRRTTFEGRPVIAAREQSTWATLPTWGAWTRWAYHPVASWRYTLDVEDLGVVINTLPVVTLQGVGEFTTEEQHSLDGVSWSAWQPIASAITARYVRLRVLVEATGATGPGVTEYTYLGSMQVVYTAQVSAEVYEDLVPSALTGPNRLGIGDIRVPLSGSFATVRVESVVVQSASGAWTFVVVDKDPALGPRIKFFNNGAAADPLFVDIVIKGIRS